MAKKYQPSGYQIIVLDMNNQVSATPFTPQTEDEKILYDLLIDEKNNKPILLDIKTPSPYHFIGFATKETDSHMITLHYGSVGGLITETILASSNKLTWTENEE